MLKNNALPVKTLYWLEGRQYVLLMIRSVRLYNLL